MEPTTALLPAAHRVIRPVDAGESAFVGVLVADGDAVRVRVDVESVSNELWRYGDAAHIAGVRDLIRRSEGHDALLPWCAERVAAFLARREAAAATLTAGEAVTLIGSVLRGLEEAGSDRLVGVWWLADDARPLFVPGEGETIIAAARSLVGQARGVIADRALDRVLADIERMPDDARVVLQRIAAWEGSLTEHAAPRPLQREVFVPERVTGIPLHRAHVTELVEEPDAGGLRGWIVARWEPLGARVHGLAARLHRLALPGRSQRARHPRATSDPSASASAPRGPRRRIALVAAAAGAVVLIAGLLWPQGTEPSQAGEREQAQSAGIDAEVTATPDPASGTEGDKAQAEKAERDEVKPDSSERSSPPDASAADDPVAAAGPLVEALAACRAAGDEVCAAATAPGGGTKVLNALMADLTDSAVSAVENYGDVAVVRLQAAGGSQMLVLMRVNDSWLVRDVYDVADQP